MSVAAFMSCRVLATETRAKRWCVVRAGDTSQCPRPVNTCRGSGGCYWGRHAGETGEGLGMCVSAWGEKEEEEGK